MVSVLQIKNSPVVTKTTIVIDSKFRTSGDINNFTYDMGTTIIDVKLIEILSVDFVNILQNVNENNNRLNWIDNLGVTHFDEITPGNYTVLTLMSELGTVMNNSNTGNDILSASVNFDTSKVTISSSESDTFSLMFGVSNETIGSIIGFGATNYEDITEQEGPKILGLYPTKHIFIGSTAITGESPDKVLMSNGVSNVAFITDVNATFSNILHLDRSRSIKLDIPGLRVLDFNLTDDNGDLIVIPSTVNEEKGTFVITLDIYSGIFDLTYYD